MKIERAVQIAAIISAIITLILAGYNLGFLGHFDLRVNGGDPIVITPIDSQTDRQEFRPPPSIITGVEFTNIGRKGGTINDIKLILENKEKKFIFDAEFLVDFKEFIRKGKLHSDIMISPVFPFYLEAKKTKVKSILFAPGINQTEIIYFGEKFEVVLEVRVDKDKVIKKIIDEIELSGDIHTKINNGYSVFIDNDGTTNTMEPREEES